MLEGLRAVQNTWIGKALITLIMGFIVVSFAVWGIGNIFQGYNSGEIAHVGSVAVTTTAFRQAYQTELQTLERQARRPITNEEAHRFGVDAQVLSRLISDAVLDDRAAQLGLAISDQQVAQSIRSDPAFAGPGGGFDRSRFDAVLRDNGYNEQLFVREQRHTYLRQEVIQAIIGGLEPPEAAIEALHRFEAETRSLDDIVLTAAALGPIAPPDAATLKTFFDSRAQDFAAPQYRRLVVLALSPASLAKPDEVSDADARKLYDEVKADRFATPERRHLEQLVFPTEAEAAAAAAKLKVGTAFADIVAERKLTEKDVDLGTVPRSALFDKAVADAAFALPDQGSSAPIQSAFGWVIVHVAGIEPAGVKPFADVAAALKQQIATSRAGKTLDDLRNKIEDARSAGKPLAEAAKAAGVEARIIDAVDATGHDKAGKPIEGIIDLDALVKAAFASDVGVDNDTLQTRDGGTLWYEVAAIDPAHPRSLDEVKPQVEAAWRADEITKRLAAKADELVKAIDGGETMEQAAASLGNLPVDHIGDAKRSGAKGLDAAAVAAVFKAPVGAAGSAAKGQDARILFKVLDSVVPPLDPDAPQSKQLKERYRNALGEDVVDTWLEKVGARLGVKVNQAALQAATGAAF